MKSEKQNQTQVIANLGIIKIANQINSFYVK